MKAGALPSSWRQTTLGEIAAPVPNAIVDGPFGSNLKLSDYVDEGVPVLQGKNITNDSFRWFDVRFISDGKATELKRSSVRVGDILIVKIGSIGYSAIVNDLNGFDFAIIPANLAKVTPDATKVDLGYLHKWLTSVDAKHFLIGAASKTAQPALSLGKIKSLPLPLPPLAEQRRIAEVLDRAGALRAKRRVALAQLDSLTQSLFLDLFGDPLANPKGWPLQTLGGVLNLLTYGLTVRPEYVSVGIPLISAKEIRAGSVAMETAAKISRKDFDALSEKAKPIEGDILFSKTGSIGHSAIVTSKTPIALAQNAARMTFKPELVDTVYALYYLRTESILSLAQRSARGNAVKDLQLGVMQQFPFPLPPIELQREFARRVEAVEKLKTAQRASLAELDALFASLQHRAFRGDL